MQNESLQTILENSKLKLQKYNSNETTCFTTALDQRWANYGARTAGQSHVHRYKNVLSNFID